MKIYKCFALLLLVTLIITACAAPAKTTDVPVAEEPVGTVDSNAIVEQPSTEVAASVEKI